MDFGPGQSIPDNWVHWRAPFSANVITISPEGHPNTLQLTASRANLTTDSMFNATLEGLTAIFRRQEHTFFNFSVDLQPGFGHNEGDEMGVSNFLNQDQHVDLGVVYLPTGSACRGKVQPYFRFRANSVRYTAVPGTRVFPIPPNWLDHPIRITVSPRNESHFEFFVAPADRPEEAQSLMVYTTALLSGDGAGTGGLFGVYATTNGGNQTFHGYISRWRYQPVAQKIDYSVLVDISV